MTKQEHIAYWKETSEDDLLSANALYEAGRYTFTLFACHFSIEKLLKAFWVKDNIDDFPPRTHNLIHLLSQTQLELEEDDIILMRQMNNWNIEGRYPDYQRFFYQLCTQSYVEEKLQKTKNLYQCLVQQLP
jgi:HEPN domain-containing protein